MSTEHSQSITLSTYYSGGSVLGTVCISKSESNKITIEFATFIPGGKGATLTPPSSIVFSRKLHNDYEFIIPVWRQTPDGTTSAQVILNTKEDKYLFVRGNVPQKEDDIIKISHEGLKLTEAFNQLFGFSATK